MKLFDLFKKKKNKINTKFIYPSEISRLKKYDDRVDALKSYYK